MCGIAGIVDWEGVDAGDQRDIKRMVWAVRHRGPDEMALYADAHAQLGHARLSIVDLSGGGQPMFNEDASLGIVFNGEIFNHVELRPELKRLGHRFSTTCDTEVILHLYEEYGPACLRKMNGQFAFAIWDRVRRRLFLARDRLGIRPLYYSIRGRRLLFASEMKSLLSVPGVEAALDPAGLDQLFTFWSPQAPTTILKDIQQLPAAHYLIATPTSVRSRRYWDLHFPEEGAPEAQHPKAYYVEGLREILVDAIRLRMRADVPVMAYLSGGLDSSLTTAMIQRYTGIMPRTFSIRFEDPRFDEGEFQAAMIERLATEHRSTMVAARDIAAALPKVLWHTETPILRTAPVPMHLLSRLVRESGVKVVITGEGADEMLAGYNIFREAKVRRFWARHPDSECRPLLLGRLYPYIQRGSGQAAGEAYWRRFFAAGLTETEDPCYSHLVRWRNTAALKRLFSPELQRAIGDCDAVEAYRERLPDQFERWAPLSQAQYIESTTFLSGYLLSSQGDRVGMSHSIEGRYPFLDHRVVEFAAQIPPTYKLRVLDEKHILKEMAGDLVPDTVRKRPKRPYRAPDGEAFFCAAAQEQVLETLSEQALRETGYFHPARVASLVQKCVRSGGAGMSARDGMAMSGVLSTQLVHQLFVATPPKEEPAPNAIFHRRERGEHEGGAVPR